MLNHIQLTSMIPIRPPLPLADPYDVEIPYQDRMEQAYKACTATDNTKSIPGQLR